MATPSPKPAAFADFANAGLQNSRGSFEPMFTCDICHQSLRVGVAV